jgi:glycosyltransferase involved in cell wall biosynthesis
MPRVIVGAGPIRVRESVGFVPHSQLGPYYERAAVVCVPSRREGYGFVAHEAMAHGRPVVATRVGGLVDAIEDGVSGLLVDPAGLRSAVERLLASPDLRTRIGGAARKHASENFRGGGVRAAYEEVLSR